MVFPRRIAESSIAGLRAGFVKESRTKSRHKILQGIVRLAENEHEAVGVPERGPGDRLGMVGTRARFICPLSIVVVTTA